MQRGAGHRPIIGRAAVVMLSALLCCFIWVADASAAGDENRELSCPSATVSSPGYRPYLPDCRAYEQVTPAFKDGTELDLPAIAENGSSAIAYSLGGFAGTESGSNTTFGPVYQLSRSPSGWTVAAITPPSPLFPVSEWVAVAPDLSRTLWLARTSSESIAAQNLYIREADGAMVKIGPEFPPAAVAGPPGGEYQPFLYRRDTEFAGASVDLSHVLFTVRNGREHGLAWPGDTTIVGPEKYSLYEYSGIGQSRPEIVGASDGSTVVPGENEGKALPVGHLISQCGTSLGSTAGQDVYNAISDIGETVFFTVQQGPCEENGEHGEGPPVTELYARVDEDQVVPISEPVEGENRACSACNESARADARFAGASRDGSKVFFLTEQELLPGAKGMNLYEYDFDNPPANAEDPDGDIVRVSVGAETPEVQGVMRVSEDGSHVYFVAKGVLTGANREGESPSPGEDNLYVFERDGEHPEGRLAFIATLPPSDGEDWNTTDSRPAQATPDGEFLVFDSHGHLTPGDIATTRQVFEYDAASEELVRVSRGANDDIEHGTESANEHPSVIRSQKYFFLDEPSAAGINLAVSENGAAVLFESQAALTPEVNPAAPAEQESAYEYHSTVAADGSISEGDVYLIVPESPTISNVVQGLDASGLDVFAQTAAVLVPQDTDTQLDVYDARVDGGFPAPDPPPGCVVEACEGSLYSQPTVGTPASVGAAGDGNVAAPAATVPPVVSAPAVKPKPKKCRKGFVRKKGKCVKLKARKKADIRRGGK